ncbi:hypothetical protein NE237_006285 [Protea cynaroides]|uniref:CCHC-type domain-containing protein n=1 Tax=Protea cynaroides TaxID=273540 RepID=A0A9Q0KMT6_9MAGN|nr:hypothetical protein NE237_006285 [Protea cynaroides]
MLRVPGINDQELMSEFARFLEQRRREDRAAQEILVRAEPLRVVERVLMRFQKQKPSIFKGIALDPVQAVEWISEMEDIFEVMDISEEHKVICAAQKGLREDIKTLVKTFQLPTYAKVLEKAQIIEVDKMKEGTTTGNQNTLSVTRGSGECRMGMGVCYHCGEKGHMAKDCNALPKDTTGQQGSNREPVEGAAGQQPRGNSRVFAAIAKDAEEGPNVVADKIYDNLS